jgi:hypothetical protein
MNWIEILVSTVLGGVIIWFITSRIKEILETQAKLNEERRKAYIEILAPYIRILADFKGKGPIQALNEMKTYEYGKTAFELALFGSDDVVRAYNEYKQYTFKAKEMVDKKDEDKAKELFHLLGKFLLEIRRDVGNRKTKLKELDMLKWKIIDIEKLE